MTENAFQTTTIEQQIEIIEVIAGRNWRDKKRKIFLANAEAFDQLRERESLRAKSLKYLEKWPEFQALCERTRNDIDQLAIEMEGEIYVLDTRQLEEGNRVLAVNKALDFSAMPNPETTSMLVLPKPNFETARSDLNLRNLPDALKYIICDTTERPMRRGIE